MGEFNIGYKPRSAMKGLVVVDFGAEFTLPEYEKRSNTPEPTEEENHWVR